MQENKLGYKAKASMLVLTLILMSLSSVFTNTINAEEARSTTGAEQILVTVLSDHYDEQSSIMVGAAVNGLNPGIDYDMKLTICYDITNIDNGNIHFTEGMHYNNYDCSERMLDAYVYDAATDEYETYLWDEVINIPAGVNNYNIAKAIEFSKISDVHPEELGTFSCNDGSTVDDWWMVNDGNNDCLDASDEGFDYANWPTEVIDASYYYNCTDWSHYGWDQPSLEWTWFNYDGCGRGYYVIAELMVGDYELVDTFSNTFAVGYRGIVEFNSLRDETILLGDDYEFSYSAKQLFSYITEKVEYDLDYSVIDLSDSSIFTTGSHSNIDSRSETSSNSGTSHVSVAGLGIGNYSLEITLTQEGVELITYTQEFEVIDLDLTGLEDISITVDDNYYEDNQDVNIVIELENLEPISSYSVDLHLCRDRQYHSFPSYKDGTSYQDIYCLNAWRPTIYDAENDLFIEELGTIEVPTGSNNQVLNAVISQEYESDVEVWKLDQNNIDFTCDDGSTISTWNMVNDGDADCADGSDEGFDYANWPTETISASLYAEQKGYFFVGELIASNYIVSDNLSNSFAAGTSGQIYFKALHPNGVLNGMDYEFEWSVKSLFRYINDPVDYEINMLVLDDSNNVVSDQTIILDENFRSITSWWVSWQDYSVVGLSPGDYTLDMRLYLESTETHHFTNDFSIIDETLSNLESLTVSASSNHYDLDEDIELSFTMDNLFQGTNYDLEWRLCRDTFELDEFPNAADGTIFNKYDCPNTVGSGPQVYDASTDSYTNTWDMSFAIPSGSTSHSETLTIASEYESDIDPWDLGDFICDDGSSIYMGWSLINDGNNDCADGSDEVFDYANWPTQIISNPMSSYVEQEGFYIIAQITVAGFEVVDAYSDSFAAGDIGYINFDSSHEGGILAGMDYKFNYGGCELFRYINTPIDYELLYWVFDENDDIVDSGTNQLIDSRSIDDYCSTTELVYVSGLTVDQGKRNKEYSLKIMLTSGTTLVDELYLDFTVTDPLAPNDDAEILVNANTGLDGVGTVEFNVNDMTAGQYYEVVYTVGIAGGQQEVGTYILIAPPLDDVETIRFAHLHDGFYCVNAKLMINNWELTESSACFSQASTVDSDGDLIRDIDDQCPDEDASAGPDVDGDGCIEYPDSDGDGWDDVDEIACGTDPSWSEDMPIDTDGDGICDGLDEDSDNDGVPDLVEIAEGTDPFNSQSKPNAPPVCDLYYAFESAGIVVVNDNKLISGIPSGTPAVPMNLTVTLPVGNYYLIAMCADPDGDLVTAYILSDGLNPNAVGPMSEVITGALVVMAPDTSETVELFVAYDDGVHFLAAFITVNLDASPGLPSVVDETTGQGVPGFTGLFSLIALIGAASYTMNKRRLDLE